MLYIITTIAVLVALLALYGFFVKTSISGSVYVIDGDTLSEDRTHRIRLYGIDAPEMSQPGGKESRQALMSLIRGRALTMRHKGKDKYGRTIALVYADGLNVNKEMVKLGYARGDRYSKTYLLTEAGARLAKRGLWENVGIDNPAQYR